MTDALASVECPPTKPFHEAQPADIGENRDAEQEDSQQNEPAADRTEGQTKAIADRLPEDSTSPLGQAGPTAVVERCQRCAGDDDQHEPQGPNTKGHPVKALVPVALQQNDQSAVSQQDGEQVGREADQ